MARSNNARWRMASERLASASCVVCKMGASLGRATSSGPERRGQVGERQRSANKWQRRKRKPEDCLQLVGASSASSSPATTTRGICTADGGNPEWGKFEERRRETRWRRVGGRSKPERGHPSGGGGLAARRGPKCQDEFIKPASNCVKNVVTVFLLLLLQHQVISLAVAQTLRSTESETPRPNSVELFTSKAEELDPMEQFGRQQTHRIGCKFYPVGENRRFERVAENLPVGSEIFKLEAHPRSELRIEPIDNSLSDVNYFKVVDIDDRFVAIKLNQSLEDLVDRRDPQNVLKFKLTCRGIGSQEDSLLPVTVYIHDVNDHAPEFQNVPYHLEVDELTPVGLTIFRSIHAIDRDKPNTANSDITYSIMGGNENDSFILSDPIEGILVMNKALDYDHGKREFKIQIQASDHGTPSLSSVTTMTIKVKDADDQNPIFPHEVYTASVSESAQITGKRIREKVRVEPPIMAYDQDTGINARLRYSIILGNENGFFEMNGQTGELFLIREIDLEKLASPTLSLQIQASQVDNPFRQALARVDIAVQDINDNSPEFEYDMYNITVIENLPPNFTVLQVFATDSDKAENAQFKYVLHDESGAFKIDPSSGWISVKDPTKLDRESTDHIRMHVTTVERKPNVNPDMSKRKRGTSVEINLLDSNDNTPFFVGTTTKSRDESTSNLEQYANCLNVSSAGASSSNNGGESNDCVVPINLYNFQVLETATPGTQIGHVYAYDRDLGDNGRVQYYKQNDSISLAAPFDVNAQNGSIFVLPQFTRLAKKLSSYTLFVKAIDSASIHFERRHSVAVVQINVTDINNSVPEFIGTTPFEAYVGESLPEGAFVSQIHARDDDSITEQLEFSIVAGNDEKLFIIDSRSGKIYTSAVLDYERKQSYDLLVQVSDGVNTAVAPLIVNIIDINDQQPVFAHQFYNFTLNEEAGPNQTVGQPLVAVDRDSGKNGQLQYSLLGELANDAFSLDAKTGQLRTRRSLDAELEPVIDFQVMARDGGIPQLRGLANVRVRVLDINDWAPRFEQARYELEVQEELEPPVEVAQIRAFDKDRDENAIIKFLIIGGNEQGLFTINSDTGQLSTAGRLNFESKREHRLQVAARNVHPFQGPHARTIVNPAVEINVRVLDINDELVLFERTHYHWRLSELTARNTIVGRVNASNGHRAPTEQDIVYWLGPVQVMQAGQTKRGSASGTGNSKGNHSTSSTASSDQSWPEVGGGSRSSLSGKFWIDERSGELILSEPLDRDAPKFEQVFKFTVYARDRKSINKQNASVPVVIDVLDVNDNAPQFDEPAYQLEMPENLPAGTTIPAFFKVHDLDSGLNGRIAGYFINGTREQLDLFQMNNVTGTITLKMGLDYERQPVHRFEIVAVDGGQPQSLAGSARVQVQVANVNEFAPKFLNLPYEFQLQENAVPGTQVGQVQAVDQDGNKIVYSMSDGDTEFFSIEPASGRIFVSRQLVPRTAYSFVVRATDDGQPQNYSLAVQVAIRVRDTNDFAPVFTSNSYVASVLEKGGSASGIGAGGSGIALITSNRSLGAQQQQQPVLVKVQAMDKDLQNNSLSYSIVGGNEESIFQVDRKTGEIRVAGAQEALRLDYDRRRQYTLLVQAQDSHETPLVGLTMVQINVLDLNDHPPLFAKAAYLASVAENAPPGTCFLRVEADPRDLDDAISYSLSSSSSGTSGSSAGDTLSGGVATSQRGRGGGQQGGPTASPKDPVGQLFEIHPTRGLLCTRVPLDREQRASYELTVTAFDGKFESQASVSVEVLDENDNRPVFDSDSYSSSLAYDAQPGRTIATVHASDQDAGANGLVQYWIKNTHGLFQIDAKTGQVRLVTRLPQASLASNQTTTSAGAEVAASYELRVFAQDQGNSPQIGETVLLVRLTNSEKHPPKFDQFAYQVSVDENVAGVSLLQVRASHPDGAKAGAIVYRLARVQSAALMQRAPSGGAHSLQSSSSGVGGTSAGVGVAAGAGAGPSGGPQGSSGTGASKAAEQQQLEREQQLLAERLRAAFKIDKSTGRVLLVEPLDFEQVRHVELLVEARDEESPDSQTTSAFVQVQVNDLNDNRPQFLATPRLLRVPSSTQPNSEIIYTMQAQDADSSAHGNNQLEYRLESPSRYFNVHPTSGVLYAQAPLPRSLAEGAQLPAELQFEQLPGGATIYSETLVIVASDRSTLGPLSERLRVQLEVFKEQADDAHPIFNANQYFVHSDAPIEPGTPVLSPKATVPNGEPVLYNLSAAFETSAFAGQTLAGQTQRNLMKRFAVDPDTGRISAIGRLEASGELGARNLFHFLVRATNKLRPELVNEAAVVLRLGDAHFRCPRFPFSEYYASVPEGARVDSVALGNLVIDEVDRFAGQKLAYQITEDNSNDNFFIDVASSSSLGGSSPTSGSTSGGQNFAPGASLGANSVGNSNANSKISVSLRVKKALDRESMPKFLGGVYTLTVSASNGRCATQARVKILVEDQNDNVPQFERADYVVELRENSPVGHVISQLQASDLDELDAGRLRYFIADGLPSAELVRATFEMEQKTGSISVRAEIDREKVPSYLLRVMALDQANNTGWTSVQVNVVDENDWAPTFANETFFMNATEGPASLGTRIRLPVFDYDDGLNRQMEVYIVEGNAGNEFRLDVDEAGPLLTIVQELDWEKYSKLEWSPLAKQVALEQQVDAGSTAVHTIQIAAKDKGSPARLGKTSVIVFIHDINDNPPKFTRDSYYEFIDESAPIGSPVVQLQASDPDSPANTRLSYAFVRLPAGPAPSAAAGAPSDAAPRTASGTSQLTATPSTRSAPAESLGQRGVGAPAGLLAKPRRLRVPSGPPVGPLEQVGAAPGPHAQRTKRQAEGAPGAQSRAQQSSAGNSHAHAHSQASSQGHAPARQLPFALNASTGVISVARQLDTSEQRQYVLTVEAFDGLWRTETQVRLFINEVEDPRDLSARSSEATNHYRFQVAENQADAPVGQVDLKPKKLRVNAQIRYSIVNSEMRQLFAISQTGQIRTLRGLDREQRQHYTFTVMLEERRGDSSKLTVAEVQVEVLDENDEVPTFRHVYHGTIRENSPIGTPVFLMPTSSIRATDNDTQNNSRVVYSLSGEGAHLFAIQPDGQVLFAPSEVAAGASGPLLDREQRADYKLDVHATDQGNLSSKTSLSIRVEDENDNAPIFETGPLFVVIPETAKAGSRIVQVRARDRDEPGPHSQVHYKIWSSSAAASVAPQTHSHTQSQSHAHAHSALSQIQQQQQQQPPLDDVIRVDQNTGELFVVGQLQPASSYNITVSATDSGGLSALTQVNVSVIDVNDHRPQFERPSYSFVVFEANYSRAPLKLGSVRAFDDDLGRNSQIEYLLLTDPQYEASLPVGNPANQLASLLQQQQQSSGSDQSSTSSSSSSHQQQTSGGQSASSAGFPISVDVHSGELFARGPIDREQRDSFLFKVMAVDLGEPALNSTCEVLVKVKDTNDEPPRFYTDPYLALVPENLEPGHKVTQIAAFDPDAGENGQVFYKLGEGHEGKFYIDGKDGTVWTLASLDYEQKNFYNITIIAYDRGLPSLHSSAKLWITVADMNDAVPNFPKAVYTLEVAENAKLGDTVFVLNAGKGAFKYSWWTGGPLGSSGPQGSSLGQPLGQPMGHLTHQQQQQQLDDGSDTFSIEPSSGHIKLARPLDSVQRNHYRLMVKAQDESEPPKFDTAEVNILVGTGQGVRLFSQRAYEVAVLENQLAPLLLIDLNCTDEIIHQPVQYSIVGSDHRGLFRIEPDTGRLSVASSLDRERRDSYVVKVRAETGQLNPRQKRESPAHSPGDEAAAALPAAGPRASVGSGSPAPASGGVPAARWSQQSLAGAGSAGGAPSSAAAGHPRHHNHNNRLSADLNELEQRFYSQSARLMAASASAANATALQSLHLAYDETFVLISVEDENDNAPVFAHKGKPIVAAVPLEASFGYEIARVQARDADAGLNGQLRYELQARNDDAATKFYVDPTSGVVRSMVNFALDSGRVYNFDVRATDRDGQLDNGNSATIQVFVYVLPETKMVLMVTDTEPIVMERRSAEVIGFLSNVTGFEVKMAKLEPHIEGNSPEPFSTDMFLYAVNPSLNNIVDTETLLNVFRQSSQTILSHLHSFKIRRIQGVSVQEKISQMGATEIAIIALSSIVFLGSIVAIVLLCSCHQQSKSPVGAASVVARAMNQSNGSQASSQQSIWAAADTSHLHRSAGRQERLHNVQQAHALPQSSANLLQAHGYSLKSQLMSGGLANKGQPDADNQTISGNSSPSGQQQQQLRNPSHAHAHLGHAHLGHHHFGGHQQQGMANGAPLSASRQTTNSTAYSTTGDGANSSEYVDSLISYKRSSGAGSGRAHPQHQGASGRASKTRADWPTIDAELAVAMNEHHLHHLHHHHQHHHHHQQQQQQQLANGTGSASGGVTALGGGPKGPLRHLPVAGHQLGLGAMEAQLKGPRARLGSLAHLPLSGQLERGEHSHEDPNTEVHSDNEVFGDEDSEATEDTGQLAMQLRDPLGSNGVDQQRVIEHQQLVGAAQQALGAANKGAPTRTRQGSGSRSGSGSGSVRSADRSIYSGESNWESQEEQGEPSTMEAGSKSAHNRSPSQQRGQQRRSRN